MHILANIINLLLLVFPIKKIRLVGRWQFVAFLLMAILSGCVKAESKEAPIDNFQLKQPAVAYNPRSFSLESSSVLSRKEITEDLRLLRVSGFRSLVTYGSKGILGSIPEMARNVGFDGVVIMGIWDPFSKEEWSNALAQAPYVDGYCLGNEGLGVRYNPNELAAKMDELRRLTGHPVTTSEPIDSYLTGPYRDWLLTHSDWLFPLAHPFWADQSDPAMAVDWIVARHDYLTANTGRNVILKEAGYPSGGVERISEETQLAFFKVLESKGLSFFYFEAFDQPWKKNVLRHHEVEAHWGIYQSDGTPKKVAEWLSERWSKR